MKKYLIITSLITNLILAVCYFSYHHHIRPFKGMEALCQNLGMVNGQLRVMNNRSQKYWRERSIFRSRTRNVMEPYLHEKDSLLSDSELPLGYNEAKAKFKERSLVLQGIFHHHLWEGRMDLRVSPRHSEEIKERMDETVFLPFMTAVDSLEIADYHAQNAMKQAMRCELELNKYLVGSRLLTQTFSGCDMKLPRFYPLVQAKSHGVRKGGVFRVKLSVGNFHNGYRQELHKIYVNGDEIPINLGTKGALTIPTSKTGKHHLQVISDVATDHEWIGDSLVYKRTSDTLDYLYYVVE